MSSATSLSQTSSLLSTSIAAPGSATTTAPTRCPATPGACPIARSLDQIGDWWTLLIVRNALRGSRRFGEFQRSLGVSRSMLAGRLRRMTADGLLERHGDEDGGSAEYRLTAKGRDL